jgi:hypothetical protein
MVKTIVWLILLISLIALCIYQFSISVPVEYDCRMMAAGWHPDAPARVIRECRKGIEK